MLKHELKAEEYRARALAALAAAEKTNLEQVRLRHCTAAATWTGLAEAEEARALSVRAPQPELAQ